MDVYEALYTTRAMRRVKPDPVPVEVQQKILDAAIRAPSGGNSQGWRFLLVDDTEIVGRLAPIYKECIDFLWANIYTDRIDAIDADPDSAESVQMAAIVKSVNYACDHFAEYPLLLFAFDQADATGGPQHQQALALLGVGPVLERVLARAVREEEGRRLLEGHRVGNGHTCGRVDGQLLDHPAPPG